MPIGTLWIAGLLLILLMQAPVRAEASPVPGLPQVDGAVDPCDNFYRYACGPWMEANPIPADQSTWGTFRKLAQDNQTILRDALDKIAAQPQPDSQRLADFYASCMDEAAVDGKSFQPIAPLLQRIGDLSAKKDLAALLADLHNRGVNAFFGFGAQTDFEDARQDIAALGQAGLGLPNRDFYDRAGVKDAERRAAYIRHVAHIFVLLGDSDSEAKAQTVMRVETALARQSLTLAQLRDPQLTHHKRPISALAGLAPDFDWDRYFVTLQAPAMKTLNIAEPDFLKAMQTILSGDSLDDIRTYLTWQTAHAFAPWLAKPFVDENFAFYGKVLSGAAEIRPRWKRCVTLTDQMLGEELGKYFVAVAFGPEHKARTLALVQSVQQAMDADIDSLTWMGGATKRRAHAKLKAIVNKIGYPEHWRDYSSVLVRRDDLVGNIENASRFDNERDIAKIGRAHDRSEWRMTPPTVNAYYAATENGINFPAGILQPPFFAMAADDAINLGAIGVVIGHEITHGFDNQGRQYDQDGNLKDWWTRADAAKFTERARCVEEQYGDYVAIGDVKQNGKATLGENLADNGGLRVALAALHKMTADKPLPVLGGFTPEQRYFLGFAQIWCSNVRDEAKRTQAMTDVHSLPEFRVNGAVSNSEAFAQAFQCKQGAAMVRGAKACRVW